MKYKYPNEGVNWGFIVFRVILYGMLVVGFFVCWALYQVQPESCAHIPSTVKNSLTVGNHVTKPFVIEVPLRYEFSADMSLKVFELKDMRVTCYSNRKKETDDSPNHAATGRFVYEGSIAVSQDLFRKKIFPGDVVFVQELNRYFIVEDTMNKRFKNCIDIFMYKRRLKTGELKKFFKPFKSSIVVVRATK